MGLLSNFIAGAAGAGGDILQRERESGVRVKESQDIARFNDELATRREQALAELRNQYQIDAEKRTVDARRAEESYQASPERIEQLRAAELAKGKGLIANRIALAPKAGEATQAEFEAGAPTRQAAQKEKLAFTLEDYRQKSAAELEAEIKKMNDPKYLQGKAKEAAAARDPNSAALHRVQLETAQLALKEKQAEAKMPPGVKLMAEPIKKEMDVIAAAIAKAQAENMFDPTTDNGKALLARHADASSRLSALLRPYLGDKAPAEPAAPKQAPPPDGTRGKIDGVMGTVINGQFVPDGAKPKPAAKQDKPTSRALPKSFDEIPGVEDTSTKVGSGVGLLSPERARLYANR